MRSPFLKAAIAVLLLSIAFTGCTSSPASPATPGAPAMTPALTGTAEVSPSESPELPGPSSQDLLVSIDPDILSYNPAISSVPGIGLSPNMTGPAYPGTLRYHWKTDTGHFISWNPPDYLVKDLGADTTLGKEKVYWTYTTTGPMVPGSTALMTLAVEDAKSGEVQAAAILEVEWDASGLNATLPG